MFPSDTALPISLIIDDPPVNAAFFLRKQMTEAGLPVSNKGDFNRLLSRWPEMEKGAIIPVDFWQRFLEWSTTERVKGKFTYLPCPAGLGCIDDYVEGYTREELTRLNTLVRDEYPKNYDITPEIYTHTMAWDPVAKKLLPQTEFGWMDDKSAAELAEYMAGALQILKSAGIIATGITQPCNYRGDENAYARAVLESVKKVNGFTHTFYFLHTSVEPAVRSQIMIADRERDEYVVSVFSAIRADEPFWQTIYGDAGDVSAMADYFITADGKAGRFIDLLKTESPLIFHAHGQTLYSNGAQTGFASLQEVVRRVNTHLAGRVEWMKIGDYTEKLISETAL